LAVNTVILEKPPAAGETQLAAVPLDVNTCPLEPTLVRVFAVLAKTERLLVVVI
jgi:hypothetical protein